MSKWRGVVIHCSDSTWGDAKEIDKWHKERGWAGIGYNFVIKRDGNVQLGRTLKRNGAHARGCNTDYIGICMIGKHQFEDEQFKALTNLLTSLIATYGISWDKIIGHYACPHTNKTCPNFDVEQFKNNINKGNAKWVLGT